MIDICGVTISYGFIWKMVRVVSTAAIGLVLVRFIASMINKALATYGNKNIRLLIFKVVYYAGMILLIITVLNELGFNLSALLGAAGIFGVAIGFASQTSMSNLISGLFLLSETFVSIGDTISCGSVYGRVESIDLFSIKVRTNEDTLVRVPNERLIKENLVNVTYFNARRAAIAVGVPGTESLERVMGLIRDIVKQNTYALETPNPQIIFDSLSSSAEHLVVQVWAEHKNFTRMKNTLIEELNARLTAEGIKTLFVMAK